MDWLINYEKVIPSPRELYVFVAALLSRVVTRIEIHAVRKDYYGGITINAESRKNNIVMHAEQCTT